jgi:ribosomal-protein-alanine N-acetyltransferase
VRDLLAAAPQATPWSIQELAARERNIEVRVAEGQGTVCGVVMFRIVADEAEILNIAVEDAERRHGKGSALMNEVFAACRCAGALRIFLEVRDSNRLAREFYARLGFTEIARRRNYYQRPAEDALVLARTV